MSQENCKNKIYLKLFCYLTIYFVWGSTYLFIRMAVQTIPPFYVVGLRFFGGGALILLFALISGKIRRLPNFKEVFAAVLLGTFLLLGGNGLVTVAEKKVDSYLAALIIATTPVVVAFFDWVLIGKKISFTGIIGVLLGICGVTVLLYDGNSFIHSFTPEILLVIGGLISWAFATSLGHKMKVYPNVFVNSAIQMLFVGTVCLIVLTLKGPPLLSLIPSFSINSIIGLLYLTVIGAAAFSAFNYLIHNEPALRVASYAFVNPIIAMVLGLALAGEKMMPYLVPGVVLILGGLFMMLYGDVVVKKRKNEAKKT